MASPELMTWISTQRRWCRMYRGKRYYVSCRQLGISPETKEASLLAANSWWRQRQADLDHAARASQPLPPLADLAAAKLNVPADAFRDTRRLIVELLLREELERKAAVQHTTAPGLNPAGDIPIPAGSVDDRRIREDAVMELLRDMLFPQAEHPVLDGLLPARRQQVERGVREIAGRESAAPDRTVRALADKWLASQKARVAIGEIVPGRHAVMSSCLAHFVEFAGPDADVSTIGAETIDGFHNHLLSKICDKSQGREGGLSAGRSKKILDVAKQFIRWLWSTDKIGSLPRNLDSHRILVRPPTIRTWTPEQFRHVLGEAKGVLRVVLLLCANCGMTQADCASLLDGEVNWRDGTISRKRTKTKNVSGTPTVTYKLWPQTFEELKKHRSGADIVLTNKNGRPYVRHSIGDNGRLKAVDLFAMKFNRLMAKLGLSLRLKDLRKSSASLLESHADYGRLVPLFLGHSPRTIASKHYAQAPTDLLASATDWLRIQYGL